MTTPIDLPTHRGGECSHCEGCGVDIYGCESATHDTYDDTEACPECPECEACEGTGQDYWAWRPNIAADTAKCSGCGAEHIETMGYGEDGEEGEVCLACLRRWHAGQCGCDLWPAELVGRLG